MCGEQWVALAKVMAAVGSPPRVRGTGSGNVSILINGGITPACAGNRKRLWGNRAGGKDHPRVCGEQVLGMTLAQRMVGSPPRVRGTGCSQRCFRSVQRITPACAGNRRPPAARRWTSRDHPRVCGEQLAGHIRESPSWGSPPRVRGTVFPFQDQPSRYGITPACAGNRTWRILPMPPAWDHPRVCGEQSFLKNHKTCKVGSPPRVRGTETAEGLRRSQDRITPACAGNSSFHPRYLAER